jgi:hypothetical protein
LGCKEKGKQGEKELRNINFLRRIIAYYAGQPIMKNNYS